MQTISLDHTFHKGASHVVCEDYATSGVYKGQNTIEYAIVADGCSSSKDTDFGARILVQSARRVLDCLTMFRDDEKNYENFGRRVIQMAVSCCNSMDLHHLCLDATLLIAFRDMGSEFPGFKVFAYGDGAIICEKKDGSFESIHITYESGAPFYLAYWADKRGNAAYFEQFNKPVTVMNVFNGPDSGIEPKIVTQEPSDDLFFNFGMDVRQLIVATDGIETFQSKSVPGTLGKSIVAQEMVKAAPAVHGEFLKRRVNLITKRLAKSDYVHQDDFSAAGIAVMED